MRFNHVFFENVGKHLKRVRIKVDPRHASFEQFRYVDSYEGYILEENNQFVKLMVIKTGSPIVDIPCDALTSPSPLDHFKYFIFKHLQILDSESYFTNIKNAARYEDVEALLKQRGSSDAEIINLYREFVKSHE
tara:strand:+ start:3205 stop:3606 length:402 start_codon:yes stop_codon:yes gene_type:complete